MSSGGRRALFETGLRIHRAARIILPPSIVRMMLSIREAMPSDRLEYGVYLKGTLDERTMTVTVDGSQFLLPKQSVTAATIVFHEEPPGPEWNVVLHRHPDGCRHFSTTDVNSINEEFLASLLFIPPFDFPDAIVNVPTGDKRSKIQIPANVTVPQSLFAPSDELRAQVAAKIQARVPAPAPAPAAAKGPGAVTVHKPQQRGFLDPLEPAPSAPRLPNDLWGGRLGTRTNFRKQTPGRRPTAEEIERFSAEDLADFQRELDEEQGQLGFEAGQ